MLVSLSCVVVVVFSISAMFSLMFSLEVCLKIMRKNDQFNFNICYIKHVFSHLSLWYFCTNSNDSSVGSPSFFKLEGDIDSTMPPSHITSHIPLLTEHIMTPYNLSFARLFLPGCNSKKRALLDATEDTLEPVLSEGGMVPLVPFFVEW